MLVGRLRAVFLITTFSFGDNGSMQSPSAKKQRMELLTVCARYIETGKVIPFLLIACSYLRHSNTILTGGQALGPFDRVVL